VILFLLFLVVLLIGLTAAAVLGKIGGFMAEPTSSHSFAGLPAGLTAGPLRADDVASLSFDQAFRGYRMDQVDQTVDALAARLLELESELASLQGSGASTSTQPTLGDPPEVSKPKES
jgi:DivIVA domain-containing protein